MAEENELTWMVAPFPMRDRRPMIAFSTVHSSRKEPWLMMTSLILQPTIFAGGKKRGEV